VAAEPSPPPGSLALPFAIRIGVLEAPGMRFKTGEADDDEILLTDVRASLESDGQTHRLHHLEFGYGGFHLQGKGQIGSHPPLPLAAHLELRGALAAHPVRLALEAEGPLTRLSLRGRVTGTEERGNFALTLFPFACQPLGEIEAHLEGFDPSRWHATLPHARLTLDATIPALQGNNPSSRAQKESCRPQDPQDLRDGVSVRIANHAPDRLDRNGLPLEYLAGNFLWQGERLAIEQIDARFSGKGKQRGRFSGKLELHKPGPDERRSLRLDGRIRAVDPATILGRLPEGGINGGIQLELHDIRNVTANAKLAFSLEKSRLARQNFEGAGHLQFAGTRLSDVKITLFAGENQMRLEGNLGRASDTLRADIAAARLETLMAFLPQDVEKPAGDLQAHLQLRGALRAPRISGTLESRRLALPGEIRAQNLSLSADLGADADAPFEATLKLGRLEVSGTRLDDNRLTLKGRRDAHDLLLETRLQLPGAGDVQLGLDARGALHTNLADWQGEIRALALRPPGAPPLLELLAPMQLAFGRDHLRIEAAKLSGAWQPAGIRQGPSAKAQEWQAEIPHLRYQDESLAGSLHARMEEIAWLSGFLGDDIQIGGRLEAALTLAGTPKAPSLSGRMTGESLHLRMPSTGMRLESGRIVLALTGERLILEQLTFTAPHAALPSGLDAAQQAALAPLLQRPGRLEGRGELELRKTGGQENGIGGGRLEFQLERLGVIQGADQWIALSGLGTMRLEGALAILEARLGVDGAYWRLADPGAPRLSDDVRIVRAQETPERRGAPFATRLRLGVDLGEAFHFSGAGVHSRLRGKLELTGENRDSLRAVGSIRTVGGRFDAYGQELAIEQGILTFGGLPQNPGLNIRAMRKNQTVEAGVAITGTAQKPMIRLVSNPEVPDAEKLSWLMFGRGPGENDGGIDNSLLFAAANAILGGQESGPGSVLAGLEKTLGVHVSVRSGAVGARQTPAATSQVASTSGFGSAPDSVQDQVLQVGARIAENLLLSYEQSLTGVDTVVKLTLILSRRLSLVGQAGTDNALDMFYSFTFGR
jgi:translocation and assembly module TamB